MLALINQKQEWTGGQGLANTSLYKLAANSTTYASAFHDVTSGNNKCNVGSTYCGTTTGGFSAGAGYDQVTGLGSVDLSNLAGAWPTNPTPVLATTTAVLAASATPNVSTDDVITITVAEAGSAGTPSGTVNLSIDGGGTGYNNAGSTTSVTLTSGGTATYTANFGATGVHTIVAQYGGDATHAASTGSVIVTVGGGASGKGNFTMSFNPTSLTVKRGSSGTEMLSVTPSGGYTGTLTLNYATNDDTALANLCVFAGTGFNNDSSLAVSGTTAVTGQITFDTNAADCPATTGGVVTGRGLRLIPHAKGSLKASNRVPKEGSRLPAGLAFAGLLMAGFLGKSSRKLRRLACLIALASLALGLSACGGGVTGSTTQDPAKGTYTITFSGMDSANNALTAQSSFTLVID
jgi:hypothetical protein